MDIYFLYWECVVTQLYDIYHSGPQGKDSTYYWSHQTWLWPWQVPFQPIREGPQINRETLKGKNLDGVSPCFLVLTGANMKQHSWLISSVASFPPILNKWEMKQETLDTHLPWTTEGCHGAWCLNTSKFSNPVWFALPFTVAVSSTLKRCELI